MNVKKKARRVMSGLLTAVTVLSTVLSPAVAYASDDAGSVKKIPYYEEIKDQLDEDAYGHFPRPAGPHFPDSLGHIKRTAQ